ncbi:HAMP domain-containing sensor histidine kinase [Salibacterium qingdaonense]|uniref:histidine kinase n=1 Tax=Salibacterium qingdaonense TaxID=266892 RepID=A0A1I4KGR4_9BACI|nr:HAMP domain-containing sensor histidine kinase [Salibacterium qingdaonense]SFL77938.1 Signal transduction histidine kinase [Salibacterium qingdaonense]
MKLSTKYILIILLAVLIFPVSFLGVNFLYYLVITQLADFSPEEYYDPEEIEETWAREIDALEGEETRDITSSLRNMDRYPDSVIFWVKDNGQLLMSNDPSKNGSTQWDVSSLIQYVEEDSGGEYFTTSAYLQGAEAGGYAFLQIPSSYLETNIGVGQYQYSTIWFIAIGSFWFLFIYISWLFFNRTRKRLVRMQEKMEINENQLIPSRMKIEKEDEIGQLEHSFNQMVEQLNESHEKEKQEALIRKRLISSLSHDLRTPLSIMNGHVHKLNQHELKEDMAESVHVINEKIVFLSELIDNLSSFTVLSEGKLPMNRKQKDIAALVRSSLIAWYPVLEEQDFEMDAALQEPIHWNVDEIWFRRILDNLLQNVLRHAAEGKYVSVRTEKETSMLEIQDRGKGMHHPSGKSGAGIGLSIVDMMLEQMELEKRVSTGSSGTTITILPKEN